MPQVRRVLQVKVTGAKELAQKFGVLEKEVHQATGRALFMVGREVIEDASNECPIDTGALRSSRFVAPPVSDREGGVKVIAGFGTDKTINPKTQEPTSVYALYVHERLDVKHPVGRAKFLELAVNKVQGTITARVAREVAARLQVAGGSRGRSS